MACNFNCIVKAVRVMYIAQMVPVASAGPHANLHLTPDRQPRQHPTTQFFTGRMPFLPPNQQCQSTEGMALLISQKSCKTLLQAINMNILRVQH